MSFTLALPWILDCCWLITLFLECLVMSVMRLHGKEQALVRKGMQAYDTEHIFTVTRRVLGGIIRCSIHRGRNLNCVYVSLVKKVTFAHGEPFRYFPQSELAPKLKTYVKLWSHVRDSRTLW